MEQNRIVSLLITSGNGPVECCVAVAHVLHSMQVEADVAGCHPGINAANGDVGYALIDRGGIH